MVVFEYKGKSAYIDGRLKTQLDTKIFPDIKKKDEDVVIIIDGEERSGKSKLADQLAGYAALVLGVDYNISNICFTPEEFKAKVKSSDKNTVIIYDEAHRGMGSRRSMSEINNILVDLMMEMGQRNLLVIIVLPTFFMLDRYAALFRARGLFHIYRKKKQKGFWVYFNKKSKLKLYINGKKFMNYNCMKWPRFRGRFYDQYIIDEKEYRDKKNESFVVEEKLTKADKYKWQRDALLYLFSHEMKLKPGKITKLCKTVGYSIDNKTVYNVTCEFEKNNLKNDTFNGDATEIG